VRTGRIRFQHLFAREQSALPDPGIGDAAPAGPAPVGFEMDADLVQIESQLGATFAHAVAALEPGPWSTPIESAYGWHRVRVLARSGTRPATFEEARSDVATQFSIVRRQEAIAAYMSKAIDRYRVEIDGAPLGAFTPSRRLALRAVPSPED
jgi:hypothetical protein